MTGSWSPFPENWDWQTRPVTTPDTPPRRFLTLDQVSELLAISNAQSYALVRRKELRAIKIGGRGQYRVEMSEVEAFTVQTFAATA